MKNTNNYRNKETLVCRGVVCHRPAGRNKVNFMLADHVSGDSTKPLKSLNRFNFKAKRPKCRVTPASLESKEISASVGLTFFRFHM
jgi:hypothetical protein